MDNLFEGNPTIALRTFFPLLEGKVYLLVLSHLVAVFSFFFSPPLFLVVSCFLAVVVPPPLVVSPPLVVVPPPPPPPQLARRTAEVTSVATTRSIFFVSANAVCLTVQSPIFHPVMPVFGIAARNVVGSIESKDKKSVRVGRLVSKGDKLPKLWEL